MKRRFLAIVRAGDRSLHPHWLVDDADRQWDLVINYYGDDPHLYREPREGVKRIDSKGPKWPALHQLLSTSQVDWRAYDYVWLPDDDLDTNCADINRLFAMTEGLGLELSQPSLSWDSYWSLALTLHNARFAMRYSSFVEPMAPCFSRALLERVVPTFGEIISGWGLDYVWPRFLDDPARQCGIIDRIQVRHTRPVGGPNYRFNQDVGISPKDEMDALLRKYGLPGPLLMSYGGLDRDGRAYNLFDPSSGDFVYRLTDGYRGMFGDKPQMIAALFAHHARAREEVLATATAPEPATH